MVSTTPVSGPVVSRTAAPGTDQGIANGASRGTAKGTAWAVLILVGIAAAAGTGRAELAAIAAPFVALLAVASALPRPTPAAGSFCVETGQALEGDRVGIDIQVPPGSTVRVTASPGVQLAQAAWAGSEAEVHIDALMTRWGEQRIGPVSVRVTDRFAVFAAEGEVGAATGVRVLPADPGLDRLLRARRTRATFGNQVTRTTGSGVEFAEIRAMQPGDPSRAVNWRASARLDTPMVNVRHAERAADVVLFVDGFSSESLALAVRAAGSLARAYLAARDRVGLVSLGGSVVWIDPAGGRHALERILAQLLAMRVVTSVGERNLQTLPRGAFPPNALVLALSPLLDPRMVDAIAGLRRRGHDVITIELVVSAPPPPPAPLGDLAARLWEVEREQRRRSLQQVGVPVVACADLDSLGPALGALFAGAGR